MADSCWIRFIRWWLVICLGTFKKELTFFSLSLQQQNMFITGKWKNMYRYLNSTRVGSKPWEEKSRAAWWRWRETRAFSGNSGGGGGGGEGGEGSSSQAPHCGGGGGGRCLSCSPHLRWCPHSAQESRPDSYKFVWSWKTMWWQVERPVTSLCFASCWSRRGALGRESLQRETDFYQPASEWGGRWESGRESDNLGSKGDKI